MNDSTQKISIYPNTFDIEINEKNTQIQRVFFSRKIEYFTDLELAVKKELLYKIALMTSAFTIGRFLHTPMVQTKGGLLFKTLKEIKSSIQEVYKKEWVLNPFSQRNAFV